MTEARATAANGPPAPMPIIVGSPRSGTTLLRMMLDAHPDLAIPPETGFLPALAVLQTAPDPTASVVEAVFRIVTGTPPGAPAWGDFHLSAEDYRVGLEGLSPCTPAEGARLFYRMYAARFGKARRGDKTPLYCRHLAVIRDLLPEARFIHIVRDGRDAAVSLRRQPFSPGHDIRMQAAYWRENVMSARREGHGNSDYLELRFEDLLSRPEAELRRICSHVGLDFREEMLDHARHAGRRLDEHGPRLSPDGVVLVDREARRAMQATTRGPLDPSRVGMWRREMAADEPAEFAAIAGDALAEYGYPLR